MGFTSSIHVRTRDIDRVVEHLEQLRERDCFVGRSGDGWVGVYSKRCEDAAGLETSRIALKLSRCVPEHILGLSACDDDFAYWLYRAGLLLDHHPPSGLRKLFHGRRQILKLCDGPEARRRVQAVISRQRRPNPAEALGMTEEEFIAKASRDMERCNTMSRQELDEMAREYERAGAVWGFRSVEALCAAIGITEWGTLYSDLAEENAGYDSARFRKI